MLDKINPTHTAAWGSLKEHYTATKDLHMKEIIRGRSGTV